MPTAKYINLYTREKSDDVARWRKAEYYFLGCLSKICLVHLFNSGLYSTWCSIYNQLRLSYFPLAFRLFPLWGINQNLSERKIKTRPY